MDEWIDDKSVRNCKKKIRPYYKCKSLKLIAKLDGVQQFTNPLNILKDDKILNYIVF